MQFVKRKENSKFLHQIEEVGKQEEVQLENIANMFENFFVKFGCEPIDEDFLVRNFHFSQEKAKDIFRKLHNKLSYTYNEREINLIYCKSGNVYRFRTEFEYKFHDDIGVGLHKVRLDKMSYPQFKNWISKFAREGVRYKDVARGGVQIL